ncbi:hypothetical protein PTKU15_85880 [Paraburkholderia terrae]|nr:hypothetical protein PTKU15_85880 [Paraburkholderia terrae]
MGDRGAFHEFRSQWSAWRRCQALTGVKPVLVRFTNSFRVGVSQSDEWGLRQTASGSLFVNGSFGPGRRADRFPAGLW